MKNIKKGLLNILFNNNKDIFIEKLKDNKKTIMVAAIIVLGVVYNLGFGAIAYKYATVASKLYFDEPSGASKYNRISDNNTMESYKGQLIDEDPNGLGSRYAGRVWADKSVEANNEKGTFNLGLTKEDDGLETNVGLNTDFLHIFSTLGSSQKVSSQIPVDLVMVLDVSGSMGNAANDDSKIAQSINAMNSAIDALMQQNPRNRVGVVLFASYPSVLMPLAHYNSKLNNNSSALVGNRSYINITRSRNFYNTPEAGGDPNSNENWWEYTFNAVTANGGVKTVYSGTDSNNDGRPDGNGQNGRGGTSFIGTNTNLDSGMWVGLNMLANASNTTTTVAGETLSHAPAFIVLGDGDPQYRTNYSNGRWWEPSNPENNFTLNTAVFGDQSTLLQTIMHASYMKSAVINNYRDKASEAKARNSETVDLGFYSIGISLGQTSHTTGVADATALLNPSEGFNNDSSSAYTRLAYQGWNNWKNSDSAVTVTGKNSNNTIRLNQLSGSTLNHVTKSQVIENINYTDKFFNADTDGQINATLLDLVQNVASDEFVPIAGDNDSGVSDSLTYMDPIGKYMEVKDKGVTLADKKQYDLGLLLFGEMHGMVKTGIYDYNTNLKIRGQLTEFKMGWYSVDEDGNYTYKGQSADAGSWDAGDIYYLDGDTTRKYVSTLPEDVDSAPEEQRNKVYTIYRFEKNITTGDTEDTAARAVLHNNPCYKSGDVQYALNEIRVWVEDSGNYTGGTGDSVIDNGYDSMIYVNIPSRALPVQVANVQLNSDGTVKDYSTNLGLDDKNQSTPFRLFYGVGVSDDIKTEDKLDIDLAKVSAEYIQSHTDTDGNVYFLSNYYSNTNYDGYVTDSSESRSRGDANFTFSPSTANRYYAFQRPLTLYELNKDDYVNSDGKTVDYTATKVFKKSTGSDGFNSFESSHSKVESVSSEKTYWIVIDYYVKGNGETVRMAVKRRGSELGSYLGEDKTAEFLVWYDPETGDVQDFNNNVRPGNSYYVATKVGGLRTGDMAQNVHTKSPNKTGSAGTYYLPTASTNSDSKSIIVNGYLGNNGRLKVSDDILEITKEVEPAPTVKEDGTGDVKFDYTLSFQDADGNDVHEGDFQAIKTFKNPYSGKWQLRLSTIDLLTDERGLLQTEDNQLAKDEKGNYIYIGGNDDEHVFHLYNAADNDIAGSEPRAGRTVYVNSTAGLESTDNVKYEEASEEHPAGSMEFWIKDYYLVTEEQLSKFDGTTTDGLTHVISDGEKILPLVIADIDSNRQMKATSAATKSQVYSKYATETQYLTETLNFEEVEGTGKYVAKFKLRHNEGLIINGLEKDYKYTVEEVLTEDQIQKGYRFDRAYGNTESDLLTPEETTERTARFGNTVQNENEVHYVNRSLNALSIVKTLKGLDSRVDANRDWHFTVKLKPGTAESVGGEYYYIVTKDNKVTRTGNIKFEDTDGDNTYTADFAIKGGEKMTIYGILDGTVYTITEKEAGDRGYTTTVKDNNDKEVTLNGDAEVEFINYNPREYDITLGKVVTGFAGETERDWNFDITLTAPEGEEIPTDYVCEGDACPADKITFTKQVDNTYKATVQLKHGEEIKIKNLLEGTTYNIVEQEAKSDNYTTSDSGNASGTFSTDGRNNFTSNQTVTFTNTKYSYHDLTVGKLVKGEDGDLNKDWTFNIYLTPASGITLDGSYEYEGGVIDGYEGKVTAPAKGSITFNKVTDSRGAYMGTVSVKHGQKVTIKGLPERTRYYVTEINSNKDGYTALIPNNNGTFDSAGASGEVIITNVNLSEHDLIIEKQVEGTDGDTNRPWNFTVTLTPDKTTGVAFIDSYKTEKNGVESDNIGFKETSEGSGVYVGHVSLKHGEQIRIKGLQEGTRYTVTEDEADQGEYFTKHTDNTEGVLEDATDTQTVRFRNIRLSRQTLTLSKVVLGGAGEYEKPWEFVIKLSRDDDIELGKSESSVTYPCEGISKIEGVDAPDIDHVTFEKQEDGSYVAKVELKHGQALTIKDIPENTKYEISETEANSNRYVTYTNGDAEGTITNNEGKGVTFYNKKPTLIDLSLSKIVNGSRGETNRDFNFTVRFKPDKHVNFASKFKYTGTKTGNLQVNKTSSEPDVYEGHVSLKHNDKITIQDIPENTTYEVVEEDLSDEGYITRDSGNTTGTLLDKGTNVEFNNTNLGEFDLSVKKTLKGNRVEKDRDWTFEIVLTKPELKDLNSVYKYTKNNDEDTLYDLELTKKDNIYVGYITLKGGETATIKGLPETTRYIVNEVEANQDNYITKTNENTEGTIDRDGLLVEYTNWRFTRHKLTIEKRLKGSRVEKDRDWTFEVTLKPKDDTPFDTVYPYVKNNGEKGNLNFTISGVNTYKAIVKLKGGEKITINGIPFETEYDVKELEANQDNYETTEIDPKGILTESEHKVVYINERYDLTKVKKVISGISGISNPNTKDEILKYVIMFIISILGGFGIIIKEYVFKK